MTDSFFDFTKSDLSSHDKSFNEEEDDTDYDALNSETFGEDAPFSDWEAAHEKLTSELEQRSFDDENDELSERVASYILDDDGEETSLPKPDRDVSRPSNSIWWNDSNQKRLESLPGNRTTEANRAWWNANKPESIPYEPKDRNQMFSPSKPLKILTVEEIEMKMRKDAESKILNKPRSPPANLPYEDREKDMPVNLKRDQMMNGHYTRSRQANSQARVMNSRGRFHQHERMQDAYTGMHNAPLPPFPDVMSQSRFPDMMSPLHRVPCPLPVIPRPSGHLNATRRPGLLFPRQLHDQPRFMGHGPPGLRRPPFPDHPPHDRYAFYPLQPSGYGRPDLAGPSQPIDEYAGLMTHQEKQWLSSIQMLQLNTNQPFQDDFYFIMNQQRQLGNSGRKINNQGMKNNREQAASKPTYAYTPLQFENSLGKLQVGSVMAPRKIIDMEVVENVENPDSSTKQVEKKSKQFLMEIEEIYTYLLQMEDYFNPLSNRPPSPCNVEFDMKAVQEKVLSTLLSENKLVSVMSIRKGKKAVLRLLPILLNPGPLIHKLLVELCPITRRDTEQLLLSFLPWIRTYLSTASLKTLVQMTSYYDTPFLLSNKFITSVMANMVERAAQVLPHCDDTTVVQEWKSTLQRLTESTVHWAETERPVVAVDRLLLTSHLMLIQQTAKHEHTTALIQALSIRQPTAPTPAPPDNKI